MRDGPGFFPGSPSTICWKAVLMSLNCFGTCAEQQLGVCEWPCTCFTARPAVRVSSGQARTPEGLVGAALGAHLPTTLASPSSSPAEAAEPKCSRRAPRTAFKSGLALPRTLAGSLRAASEHGLLTCEASKPSPTGAGIFIPLSIFSRCVRPPPPPPFCWRWHKKAENI